MSLTREEAREKQYFPLGFLPWTLESEAPLRTSSFHQFLLQLLANLEQNKYMRKMPNLDELPDEAIDHVNSCPHCHHQESLFLFVENGFPYVECESCGLIYLAKRVKEENLDLIYNNTSYHSTDESDYQRVICRKRLALFNSLPPNGRVHEDAASNGTFVDVCLKAGFKATGSDISAAAAAEARRRYAVEVKVGFINDVGLNANELDAFAAFDLLCHLYAPWNYIKDVHRFLKPSGQLLLRTGDRSGFFKYVRRGRWSAPEHVYHFPLSLIKQMLQANGFRVKKVTPAFDSDFPYFLYGYSRTGSGVLKKVASSLCSNSVRAWNLLGLPKDDLYILAEKVSTD